MKTILVLLQDIKVNKYLYLLEPIMDQAVSVGGVTREVHVKDVVYLFKAQDDFHGIQGLQFDLVLADECISLSEDMLQVLPDYSKVVNVQVRKKK